MHYIFFPRAYSELFASCGGSDIRVWHAASLSELLRIQARARARGGGRDGWGGYGRGGGGTVLDDCHVLAMGEHEIVVRVDPWNGDDEEEAAGRWAGRARL